MARNGPRIGKDIGPIELDVDLKDEALSHEGVKRLAIQLVKHLLFQKKQIPQTVESIQRDVRSNPEPPGNSETANDINEGGPAKVQELLRQKRMVSKQMRIRQKYLARAKSFVERYQAFEDEIVRHMDRQVTGLCCVFGASPAHPKEVYTIELPDPTTWAPAPSEKANRRAMLTLFRSMANNEAVFKMLDTNTFLSTNLFVALRKPCSDQTTNSPDDDLILRPGFKHPPRCRQAVIKIRQESPDKFEWSSLETPVQPRRFTSLAPSLSCTPVPMDICTPLVSQRHIKLPDLTPGVATALDMMAETPCVKRTKCNAIAEEPGEESQERKMTTPVTDTSSLEWMFISNSLKGFTYPKA